MNISLLGATGRVGSIILENALVNNHFVHILVRDKSKVRITHPNLKIVEGNALNEKALSEVITGSDAVISALNTDGTTTLSESMPMIIHQMKNNLISRIITIGTAGILQARSNPSLYRFQSAESKRKTTKDAEEHLKAYLQLKNSGLDWTVVCPTYLPTGERLGIYRYEKNFLPEDPSSISVYDTADFAFLQLENQQFIQSRVGLTY
ncbi:MAG: NAD(P)H-binding protein [Bacillota bacterium]|nr:NAD(P)H-binding protein [Bacillota bacterium]